MKSCSARALARTALGLVTALTLAMPSHAQRLMEQNGIELRASARVVAYGAATCEIREGFAGDDKVYDPANRGQPLDVWQLDFSVYNGSGKWLDHLIARYNIASEWPPCSSWDGPRAGTVDGSVDWSDTSGFIQESGRNAVEPGQALTATTYLVVFHSDVPPQFDGWSLDYDFAAAPPAGRQGSLGREDEPPVDVGPTAASDRSEPHARIPVEKTCAWQHAELVREKEARGIQGDDVRKRNRLRRDRKDLFGAAGCWQAARDRAECHYFEPKGYGSPTSIAWTWTGGCSDGKASGRGELLLGDQSQTGEMSEGKRHGQWVEVSDDLSNWNLSKVLGKQIREGPYVDGRKHGLWMDYRDRDGKVREIRYENHSTSKIGRWRDPDRNRGGRGWGRIATAVLGGAAIAAAGDGSELAVEAGLGFAEEVLGDGGAGSGPGLTVDSPPGQESALSGIPGCQEFSAPALENDRQAWAHCGNAYANSCRITQISDPSYKAKYPEVSQTRIDQGIAESRAIISRSCQAITVTGSSVSDCSYCEQP